MPSGALQTLNPIGLARFIPYSPSTVIRCVLRITVYIEAGYLYPPPPVIWRIVAALRHSIVASEQRQNWKYVVSIRHRKGQRLWQNESRS